MDKKKELSYEEQKAQNDYAFRELLKAAQPELFVLFDVLEQTQVNWFVVVKIIRALNNIAMGNGYGTISINIENGRVMFVKGEESDRVNEPILLKKKE